jgi:hypothetical protein
VRRIAVVAACVGAGWLVLLLVLGLALGARQEAKTTERLAESLQAQVTIADSNLALIRGRWELAQLAIRHDDVLGKLAIDVAGVRCELAPLGWALVDRDCSELVVRGVRMEVSSTALFRVKRPKRRPVHADRIVIDDAELVFEPSAFVPNLGRVAIAIEHAESGPTVLCTPLSWLLTLDQLHARLDLPAGIALHLDYAHGTLTATRNRMPRWLSEGISVYEERQANPAWGETMNLDYRRLILGGEATPITNLSSAFLTPRSPLHLQFAYFESSMVVDFPVQKFGFDTLKSCFRARKPDRHGNRTLAQTACDGCALRCAGRRTRQLPPPPEPQRV